MAISRRAFGVGLVAIDDAGWSRAVDERKHVTELEVGEGPAAVP